MPYIITTTPRPTHDQLVARIDGVELPRTRAAVATLDEAREAAHSAIPAPTCGDYHGAIYSLSDSGGTVGPLPDGTVIEVAQVTWTWLASQTLTPSVRGQANILCAFNGSSDRVRWYGPDGEVIATALSGPCSAGAEFVHIVWAGHSAVVRRDELTTVNTVADDPWAGVTDRRG